MPEKQVRPLQEEPHYLDLLQEGDMLLNATSLSKRERQTASPSTSTLPLIRSKIRKSGWEKPTVQLAALLGMERDGFLSLGGKRRLIQMLASQPTSVIAAALRRRDRISSDPSFEILRSWANRPFSVKRSPPKIERRRIGVGYRDKGSLLPSHMRGRRLPEGHLIFLGESKEWISSLPQQLYIWFQEYGYLMHHVSDGWWAPDIRLQMHINAGRAGYPLLD